MKRKKQESKVKQLSLFPKPSPQVTPVAPLSETGPRTAQKLDLTHYSRANLIFHGWHDNARRAWLAEWGQEHGYPKEWLSIQSKSSGWYQVCVPKGEEAWKTFLEDGTPFDVYCLFLTYSYMCSDLDKKMRYLPDHLNDAVERGEIGPSDIAWTSFKNFG